MATTTTTSTLSFPTPHSLILLRASRSTRRHPVRLADLVFLTHRALTRSTSIRVIASSSNELPISSEFTSMASNLKDNNKNNRITSPSILFANSVDQVIDEVNSCVKNETKGLIKNFLPPGCLYGETALLFANALYFEGQWDQKFDKTRTRNMNFHLLDGEIVQVPFMTSKRGGRHLYGLFGGYKILSIPYQEAQVSNPGFMNQEFGLRKEDVSKLWIPRFKGAVLFTSAVLNPLLVA
ncbi:unnamed protein product [Camellia sinensis]